MKNKTKRILAGACLGVAGSLALTGCSMTEEQQKALDSVTANTDRLVTLIDDYLTVQNKELSKQEAYEMLSICLNLYEMNKIDQYEVTLEQKSYDGRFEKIDTSRTTNQIAKYRKGETFDAYGVISTDTTESVYYVADYTNDKYYNWVDNEKSEITFDDFSDDNFTKRFLSELLSSIGTPITPENIFDIDVAEDGTHTFTLLNTYEYELGSNATCKYQILLTISIKDNLILSVTQDRICTRTESVQLQTFTQVDSDTGKLNFKYSDIDFSDIDAKINSLNA